MCFTIRFLRSSVVSEGMGAEGSQHVAQREREIEGPRGD